MNKITEEQKLIDLEYNLISDFIKLRNELGLTQKEMGEASNTIREIIAVIETRKKTYANKYFNKNIRTIRLYFINY